MQSNSRVVIAGGGTGGHVYPALAIADGLVELGIEKQRIIFFGSGRTIENELVPSRGYRLITFPGRGLNRQETLKNFVNIAMLKIAILKALFLFIKSRPQLVIGVGGYASVPAMIAASILRIDRVVHEQNAVIGRTNLIAQRLGAKIITTFPKTQGAPQSSIRLGLPLSNEILEAVNTRRTIDFGKRGSKQVVVSGGSLGSVRINEVVVKMVSKFRNEIDFSIIHICGKNNYEKTKKFYESVNCLENIELHSYRDDLSQLYATSDCVVSRAGGGTCVELEALGVDCILIPLPSAPGNHQYKNSEILERNGLAIILDQESLNADHLFDAIQNRLTNSGNGEPNAFNLESKSRISNYLLNEYGLLKSKTRKN